jgi:hypothetical protein
MRPSTLQFVSRSLPWVSGAVRARRSQSATTRRMTVSYALPWSRAAGGAANRKPHVAAAEVPRAARRAAPGARWFLAAARAAAARRRSSGGALRLRRCPRARPCTPAIPADVPPAPFPGTLSRATTRPPAPSPPAPPLRSRRRPSTRCRRFPRGAACRPAGGLRCPSSRRGLRCRGSTAAHGARPARHLSRRPFPPRRCRPCLPFPRSRRWPDPREAFREAGRIVVGQREHGDPVHELHVGRVVRRVIERAPSSSWRHQPLGSVDAVNSSRHCSWNAPFAYDEYLDPAYVFVNGQRRRVEVAARSSNPPCQMLKWIAMP